MGNNPRNSKYSVENNLLTQSLSKVLEVKRYPLINIFAVFYTLIVHKGDMYKVFAVIVIKHFHAHLLVIVKLVLYIKHKLKKIISFLLMIPFPKDCTPGDTPVAWMCRCQILGESRIRK